jgi:hypothetical protein
MVFENNDFRFAVQNISPRLDAVYEMVRGQ